MLAWAFEHVATSQQSVLKASSWQTSQGNDNATVTMRLIVISTGSKQANSDNPMVI